jgi:23S rRNA (guanine745-N1)-methyltransferase
MIEARREFLGGGFYEPLAKSIAEASLEVFSGGNVLDAGCGEGYYTRHIKEALEKSGAHISAFDISKDAVIAAAKGSSADEYAVASSYRMPVADASVDLMINTFSPQAAEQTKRVIAPGGHFIMAIPAEEHLFGLKEVIYKTPYKNTVEDTALDEFTLVGKKEIKYTLELNKNSDIRALFMMTPYAYRTKREDRDKVLSMDFVKTDIHFLVLTYKRNA